MNKVLVKVSRIANILSEHNHVILLSTVGLQGGPRSRFMGGFMIMDNAEIFLISPANATKMQEVMINPQVQVIFSSSDHRQVLTLSGKAQIVRDIALRRSIYEKKRQLKMYPIFTDNFGVIHFVPTLAEYLNLQESDDTVSIPIPRD